MELYVIWRISLFYAVLGLLIHVGFKVELESSLLTLETLLDETISTLGPLTHFSWMLLPMKFPQLSWNLPLI